MTTAALLLAAGPCPIVAGWRDAPPPSNGIIEPAHNVVRIEGTALFWNDAPIDSEGLAEYGRALAGVNPRPRLIVEAGHADCAALLQVTQALGEAAHCDRDHCFVVHKSAGHE